jgi:hypothetical protein
MTDLFSDEWMKKFQQEWNDEPELSAALEKIEFSSVIGYGFKGDEKATGFIRIEGGKVTEAGSYEDQELNWDMRAEDDNWNKWLAKDQGMTGLGMAVTTGKLKFNAGDFKAMVKDPRMAAPFVKSFSVMGKVR